MGFPTVNLEVPEDKFVVRRGVYCSRITLGSRVLFGVTNVGRRPTVEDAVNDVVETFIFDFDEDIYGLNLHLTFLEKIRDEQRFDSIEALSAQLARDRERCRSLL